MNIEKEYSQAIQQIEAHSKRYITAEEIISLLDLTLLDTEAKEEALEQFVGKLRNYPVAAACVYPQHLTRLPPVASLKKATVVNFPSGNQPLIEVEKETHQAINAYHVDEIDYVFPYSLYLNNDTTTALSHCYQMYELCRQKQVGFKVILETGAFTSLTTLYRACREILEQGCDFLKTSTGKIATGASPLTVFTLLKALHDSDSHCGLKVSGGVKQKAQALEYIHMAEFCRGEPVDKNWFRIGASSLLDELTQ